MHRAQSILLQPKFFTKLFHWGFDECKGRITSKYIHAAVHMCYIMYIYCKGNIQCILLLSLKIVSTLRRGLQKITHSVYTITKYSCSMFLVFSNTSMVQLRETFFILRFYVFQFTHIGSTLFILHNYRMCDISLMFISYASISSDCNKVDVK